MSGKLPDGCMLVVFTSLSMPEMGAAVAAEAAAPAATGGTAAASGSQRERSDVADLQKQLLQEQSPGLPRNNSWSGTENRESMSPELAASRRLREPGGFRRGFLQTQAINQGLQAEDLPQTWSQRLVDTLAATSFQVESHVYGLNLSDDEDAQPIRHGASNLSIAFLIFKGNCGCAILYMPRGWMHGGLLLASIAVPLIGFASIWCALLLLKVRLTTESHAGYGDLMNSALGPSGRAASNLFIVLLQLGICCTYFIVASKLLQTTLLPKTSLELLIAGMAVLMVPLVAVRKVASLWPLSLAGTALVILGLLIVGTLEVQAVVEESPELTLMNWSQLLVCIGQACFMFEGIGLILPTYDASKKPEDFSWIYVLVQTGTLAVVCAIGVLGYMAFGSDVSNLILLNFPQSIAVFLVRFAFMLQVWCSFPLQFLPATRLLETFFFTPVSDPPLMRKAAKTAFRALVVVLLAGVAVLGASKLDNFVSLIGALCGVPLAFVFPAVAHYILVKECLWLDILLVAFGIALTVVVTGVNVAAFF